MSHFTTYCGVELSDAEVVLENWLHYFGPAFIALHPLGSVACSRLDPATLQVYQYHGKAFCLPGFALGS